MSAPIAIEALRVSYNGTEVVRGIDLSIAAGAITAIIGPSGCGKTTVLRTLNRLAELTPGCRVSGAVRLGTADIMSLDPVLLRRRIGMVFQKPNPFPKSIRANVLYGVRAGKMKVVDSEVVRRSLESAAVWEEVKDRLDGSALALSLGQQQRLCVARTLAVNPEVVLMDEPAASLDPLSTSRLEASIASMKGDYTVVVVTHNMQQALRISDYTAFVYMGEVVEFGETRQVFEAPRRQETRRYIAGEFG